MAAMGRISKLTEELVVEAEKYCALGNFEKVVARQIGITHATWCSWKAKGRAGKQPYLDFLERITRALNSAEVQAVACIKSAMTEDWRAASWYLERRFRSKWGKIHMEVTGKNGQPLPPAETHVHINLDLAKLADEELSLYERLAERSKPPAPHLNGNGESEASSD